MKRRSVQRRSVHRRSVQRRTSKCEKGTVSTRGVRLAARATATVPSVMPYEKFDAWRAAHALALAIYGITEKWPKHELFGLTSQTRRAALSYLPTLQRVRAKGAGWSSAVTSISPLDRRRNCLICFASARIGVCSATPTGNRSRRTGSAPASCSGASTDQSAYPGNTADEDCSRFVRLFTVRLVNRPPLYRPLLHRPPLHRPPHPGGQPIFLPPMRWKCK
jgi:23S rRNA-intervening sequence protein